MIEKVEKSIFIDLYVLHKWEDIECIDKLIPPRPFFGWKNIRTLWINLYHNLKIIPNGRYECSYLLVYGISFGYKERTGKIYFRGGQNNKKVEEIIMVRLWKRVFIWLLLSNLKMCCYLGDTERKINWQGWSFWRPGWFWIWFLAW